MIDRTKRQAKTVFGAASMLAATIGLSGCINIDSSFDGVPLDQLADGDGPPVEITLAGPDDLIVTVGDTLDISVEGDDEVLEDLRFKRKGDSLAIGRESSWGDSRGKAIIRVTMPAPRSVALAGSGDIDSETLASDAEVSIAGSGKVKIGEVAADELDISIAGSGSLSASGSATELEISIAGSGDIDFAGLKADKVDISIAGSGDIELASDGVVEASIAGSGDVTVTGSATCKSSAMGSGTVTCKPATATAQTSEVQQGDAE